MGQLDHWKHRSTSSYPATKFSSFVSIYEWAAYAGFSIFKQFYLHILWNGEDMLKCQRTNTL